MTYIIKRNRESREQDYYIGRFKNERNPIPCTSPFESRAKVFKKLETAEAHLHMIKRCGIFGEGYVIMEVWGKGDGLR